MPNQVTKAFTFALERWIQRGVLHQLVLMAALVALVAVVGGLSAWVATARFESAPEAMWWAFLRLTDPGYLGDDEGATLRVISTIVTVLGYVIFMGSLIAIMTQWLAKTMLRLELGLTPISMQGHVVILGWTNRTPEVVAKLMSAAGRLDRFLEERKIGRLRIVVLSDEVDTERRQEMRDYLGTTWRAKVVYLRSGSSLRTEHLQRLDLGRASVVIVPGSDFELGGAELTDARVIKTLLTMRNLFRDVPTDQRPQVVAEIFDSETLSVAQRSMDESVEVVSTDRVISRLVSQSIRHRGMAEVLFGLLTHRENNSLYVRRFPELAGQLPRTLGAAFPSAIVLGLVRREADGMRAILDPGSDEPLRADDLLVLLAGTYAECQPSANAALPDPGVPPPATLPLAAEKSKQSVLVLGWSHKVARLIDELSESSSEQFDVTIMSRADPDKRQAELERAGYSKERVDVHHVIADYSIERDLAAARPDSFDYVVFIASSWMDSSEDADARTVLGYVLLRSMLEDADDPPEVLIELLDPANAHLFEESDGGLVLVSPRVLSHVLAHVALRQELNTVFDALFCSGGTEIGLRHASSMDLVGRPVAFAEIQETAAAHGMVALGVMTRSGASRTAEVNPARAQSWTLGEADQLIVLAATG